MLTLNRIRHGLTFALAVLQATSLLLLACDAEENHPSECEAFLACYQVCAPVAVTQLDAERIATCNAAWQEEGGGFVAQKIVDAERDAVQAVIAARAAEGDGEIDYALARWDAAIAFLGESLSGRAECQAQN